MIQLKSILMMIRYAYASSHTSHDRRPQLHLPRLSVTTAINVKMIISSAQLLTLIES
jgi:hypothetical protein